MSQVFKVITYPVRDLSAAKAFYTTLLGTEPYADSEYYVGYRLGDQEIGLDPNGHATGLTGPIGYHPVDDLEAAVEAATAAGATLVKPIAEVGPGRRIAAVADADGNVTGLMHG
ncbi:Glyoxalase/bleomycin resistance protein/dioxygenase [Beutenbergia cavernae DSM 12333]|uniref:Glyoxalase/bleomycin resistance protein/dioxygenase n=1 Tax=Beutenbergia cavernae (strain ATCC BAA-8 / DSM 12333 / CCUG 43141 / JCM 11478 / NBRC 16432 / NCIMB 13614 / HKI 0122) TaxID=471853 RepID=C5BWK6_BEUC1|nr:VOC family protein [Beutenbergia cavernae]ACQ78664.1 Glyoxalase/bleomycin resistance protein/dioxygenase [Beutenbergia cavernae DSM 12333]